MASMIESVKARRRGAQDFEGYYSQLCALQDSCPLSAVKAHLEDGVLDLNADRIRLPDWMPILNALRINRSLQFIAFRSYFQSSKQEDSKSHSQTHVRRPPPVRSRDITHRLSIALRECLANSEQLQHVELQGLMLREKNMVSLCIKGLAKSRCLQHLSLEYCRIGDQGVEVLCQCVKNSPTIISLNLTAAGLTWKSADVIAKLVKHQATQRHTEAWKDSLRYRRPDLDRMPGIRRITINNNPLINDRGAKALAEALKDDLWLKALDMQHCGISNVGAKALLDTLHHNTSIVVLDLRRNPLLDQDLLKAVIEQVMINSGGQEVEYKWLRARSPKDSPSKQKNKRRGRSSSMQMRKPSSSKSRIKSTSSHSHKPERRTRSKSESGITVVTSKEDLEPTVTRPGPGFVPWRTAARANQRSKHMLPGDPGSPAGSSTPTRPGASSIHVHVGSSSEFDTSAKDSMATPSTHMSTSSTGNGAGYSDTVNRKIKNLQVEAEELRRRLYIESKARAASDERVIELEVENSRLKHQLQLLEARGPTSPLKKQGPEEGGENGEDEALLESIEESFKKFHGFLDLLRDAGLGQLCSLVGLSSQDIAHPTVKSILKNHQPSTQPGYQVPSSTSTQEANSIYQPGNMVYSNQAMQPAPYNFGMMGPMMPGMQFPNLLQQQQHANQMSSAAFQQAPGMQQMMPGVYPQMMNAYPQQMPGAVVPGMQGQVPVNQNVAPQMQMYQQPIQQPVLANQQPQSTGLTNGGSHTAPSSTSQSRPSGVNSVATLGVSSTSVTASRKVLEKSKIKATPAESMSSAEEVFMPSVVQISSGPQLSEDQKKTTSGSSLPTVQPQHKTQLSLEPSDVEDQDKHQEDSHHDDRSGTRSNSPFALHVGQEPGLQRVADSFESDIGNIRQMTELDFGESVESTPRVPDTKYIEDSPRVESATPTKGIGSPTESDHSGRGPPKGASPTPSYSEDFEGGADDDDDESEIGEDLFQDSEGSLPGLTSDDEF